MYIIMASPAVALLGALDAARQAKDLADFSSAGLEALQVVLPADYYSVVSFRTPPAQPDVGIFELGRGWLGPEAESARRLREAFEVHPTEQHPAIKAFLANGSRSDAFLRSELLPDRDWHSTVFYQTVDRHLRIRDMVSLVISPEPGRIVALNASRYRSLGRDRWPPIRRLAGILQTLAAERRAHKSPPPPASIASVLSPRELEVLGLIEQGGTNIEIAAALAISPGTVRKHVEHILEKLGARNRTAAVHALRRQPAARPAARDG